MAMTRQSKGSVLAGLMRVRDDLDAGRFEVRGTSREKIRARLSHRIAKMEEAGVKPSLFWPGRK